MPEVDTNLFTEDDILCEFDDPMSNPALSEFPSLDLPRVEPKTHMSPPQVAPPVENSAFPSTIKLCPKITPLIKPKPSEQLIQPNYVIEKSDSKKIRFIQKPGTNTVVPVQNIGQIHLPSDQIKQVYTKYSNIFKFFKCYSLVLCLIFQLYYIQLYM